VKGKVPSYLGTSASFVAGVAAIRGLFGGDTPAVDKIVTGAILVAGLVLAIFGLLIHFLGVQIIHRIFPPVVTGGVVMLIGFGLAYVVADVYWPQDQWIALITMITTFLIMVVFRGFIGRIAVLLGLVAGFVLSWVADRVFGDITAFNAATGQVDTHPRVSFAAVAEADWIGLPNF